MRTIRLELVVILTFLGLGACGGSEPSASGAGHGGKADDVEYFPTGRPGTEHLDVSIGCNERVTVPLRWTWAHVSAAHSMALRGEPGSRYTLTATATTPSWRGVTLVVWDTAAGEEIVRRSVGEGTGVSASFVWEAGRSYRTAFYPGQWDVVLDDSAITVAASCELGAAGSGQ